MRTRRWPSAVFALLILWSVAHPALGGVPSRPSCPATAAHDESSCCPEGHCKCSTDGAGAGIEAWTTSPCHTRADGSTAPSLDPWILPSLGPSEGPRPEAAAPEIPSHPETVEIAGVFHPPRTSA
jgi:hypothetical protein